MTAAKLAKALGGRRYGRHWQARCPAHDDHDPSLSISVSREGVTLVHCFAGCSQDQVIDALRHRGLWANGDASHDRIITPERYKAANEQRERESAERAATVLRIWNEGVDPAGTLAEKYLTARSLHLPPELRVLVLRFHPACPWESVTVPCLITAFRAIAGDDAHRRSSHPPRSAGTLAEGRAHDVGQLWPAVRSSSIPAGDRLAIGEGVETCMAARQLGLRPVWALGTAGGDREATAMSMASRIDHLGENDDGANRKRRKRAAITGTDAASILTIPTERTQRPKRRYVMERTHDHSAETHASSSIAEIFELVPDSIAAGDTDTEQRPASKNDWPVMDKAAYYGLAGDFVKTIEPHTEADPVGLLIQFLVAFGSIVGAQPYYLVENDKHRANLYAVLVGDSARGRKGTGAGRVRSCLAVCRRGVGQWAKRFRAFERRGLDQSRARQSAGVERQGTNATKS